MFISDFAIKKPLLTVVAMLALVGFGTVALTQLQTDEFPEVQPPVVLTTVVYPGASPEQVEREVLEPIEEAIQAISGVKNINGEARDGSSSQRTCRKPRRKFATPSAPSVRISRRKWRSPSSASSIRPTRRS